MKVVGYIRVSTSAQTDMFGLDAQRKQIEEWCSSHGHEIIGWYEEMGVSGVKESRPELDRLLYSSKVGNPPIEAVVVAANDRIARNIELYYAIKHQLRTKGVELFSVKEDFGGFNQFAPILESLMAAMAEIERGTIAQRTKGGRMVKAASGKYSGGAVPYGYSCVNHSLVVNEDEAEMVRYIFSLRQRMTLREICSELSLKGYKTRKGTPFSIGGVKSILDNERTYRGEYKYSNGVWVKGEHEPIIR